MSYRVVMSHIEAGGTLIIDGATGTELERRGVPMHAGAWCALATESHPQVLRRIHEDYIRAGARLVTANTFATTREVLEPQGLGSRFEDLNRRAVEIAVEARERVAPDAAVLVAGSISHTRPAPPDQWSPRVSSAERFEADCTEMAAIHKAAGCDLILAEMMGDARFTPAVIRAARANDLPVWVGLSALRRPDGAIGTYTDDRVRFEAVLEPIAAEGADVMGVMHSKADLISPALAALEKYWPGPLLVYPDCMRARDPETGSLNLDEGFTESVFIEYCARWLAAGVQVLGGCCGLTVSHIEALARYLQALTGPRGPGTFPTGAPLAE